MISSFAEDLSCLFETAVEVGVVAKSLDDEDNSTSCVDSVRVSPVLVLVPVPVPVLLP